jgi:hypothetical protein
MFLDWIMCIRRYVCWKSCVCFGTFSTYGVAGASLVGLFISACGNLVAIAGERGFESWLLCIVGVR